MKNIFTKNHIKITTVEDNTAKLSITEYLERNLGEIIYLQFTKDQVVKEGVSTVSLESVKMSYDILAPFDLEIIKINRELVDDPAKLNHQTPFMEVRVLADIKGINESEYESYLRSE